MSGIATRWALKQRGLKPAAKIVLWYLSDCHNGETGECFPMQATIAEHCEMSRSAVNRHLDTLEELGLILRENSIDERTKRQRPTRYVLMIGGSVTVSGNKTRPVSESDTRAVSQKTAEPCPNLDESRVPKRGCNLRREPGSEPKTLGAKSGSTPLSQTSIHSQPAPEQPFQTPNRDEPPERFAEFWSAYPLKSNKVKAEAEFITATLRGGDPGEIVAGAMRFAVSQQGKDPTYIPQPANWLRNRRWTDEIPDAVSPKSDKAKRLERVARRYA